MVKNNIKRRIDVLLNKSNERCESSGGYSRNESITSMLQFIRIKRTKKVNKIAFVQGTMVSDLHKTEDHTRIEPFEATRLHKADSVVFLKRFSITSALHFSVLALKCFRAKIGDTQSKDFEPEN
jgi:hypothetical protein